MRKLSNIEISQISGADSGTTFAGNAGATLGAAAGAAIGGRVGMSTPGAAIGSGVGALAGETIYNTGKNAVNSWNPSAFQGSSFFPQTPSGGAK
ncbi:glycine zipper domain-containing protein [Pseudomonas sp. MDT1-85]